MLRFPLVFFALLLCTATPVLADDPKAPDAALKSTVDQFLGNLRLHAAEYRQDKASYYAMVDEVVAPRLDAPRIAWFALGKHARTATADQRKQFADLLTLNLLHSYADFMLGSHTVMEVSWKPVHAEAGADRATVHSVLTSETGTQNEVGFSMQLADGDWKICDLDVDGISLELNYRTQLNAEIARTSLDAVIARMTQQESRARSISAR